MITSSSNRFFSICMITSSSNRFFSIYMNTSSSNQFFSIYMNTSSSAQHLRPPIYYQTLSCDRLTLMWNVKIHKLTDVIIGQCVVLSDRHLACAVFIRHKAQSDGEVESSLLAHKLVGSYTVVGQCLLLVVSSSPPEDVS